MRRPDSLIIKEQETFLEQKLTILSDNIAKYAIFAAFCCFVVQLVYRLILIAFNDDMQLVSNATLLKIVRCVIIAVVILIVAIPEGLPLAVSIAMALSIDRLKKDEILIKNLESI
jgi:Ca2+ transporting ATPase